MEKLSAYMAINIDLMITNHMYWLNKRVMYCAFIIRK